MQAKHNWPRSAVECSKQDPIDTLPNEPTTMTFYIPSAGLERNKPKATGEEEEAHPTSEISLRLLESTKGQLDINHSC